MNIYVLFTHSILVIFNIPFRNPLKRNTDTLSLYRSLLHFSHTFIKWFHMKEHRVYVYAHIHTILKTQWYVMPLFLSLDVKCNHSSLFMYVNIVYFQILNEYIWKKQKLICNKVYSKAWFLLFLKTFGWIDPTLNFQYSGAYPSMPLYVVVLHL